MICRNLSNFYKPVSTLTSLGGSYHFSLLLSPLAKLKQLFSITETVCKTSYLLVTPDLLLTQIIFGSWVITENWSIVNQTNDVDCKALSLQICLIGNYMGLKCFEMGPQFF